MSTTNTNPSPPRQPQPTKITMPSILHTTSHRPKPWHTTITLDLILHVASRSIFHPAIILIFYLCLAAVPPHHHRHPLATPTLFYASFLLAIRLLLLLNHRITNGPPRTVKWDEEIVVITGGATGLGRTIAELLLVQHVGVRVAIIDVKEPDETQRAFMRSGGEFEGRLAWHCIDVRNSAAVKIIAGRIKEEFGGGPTIIVNNAAMAVNGLLLVAGDYEAGLSSQQAEKTLLVNTMGNFNVLSAFLGPLMSAAEHGRGATVVTVSSLLGHLNPSRLADYNASKAALTSLHHTLTAEVRSSGNKAIRDGVKTVLVEPGQIATQLFADITSVPWYANFFGPVLEVNEVAKAIVRQLESGESGVIRMPFYSKCMPLYGALPGSLQRGMRWFSGIDKAIVGRSKKA